MSEEENTFNNEEDTSNNQEENTSTDEEEEEATYTYNGEEYDNEEDFSKAMSDHRKEMIESYKKLKPLKKLDDTVDNFVKVAKATFFETHVGPTIELISAEFSAYKESVAGWFSETNTLLNFLGYEVKQIRPEVEKHAKELAKIADAGIKDPMFKTETQEETSNKGTCEVRGSNLSYFSHKVNKATKKIMNDCECPDGFVPYSSIHKGDLISDRGCVENACDYSDSHVTFSGVSGTCMQTETIADTNA